MPHFVNFHNMSGGIIRWTFSTNLAGSLAHPLHHRHIADNKQPRRKQRGIYFAFLLSLKRR
jgi:hypothetical protein